MIISGKAHVYMTYEGIKHEVAALRPGEIFGVSDLLKIGVSQI